MALITSGCGSNRTHPRLRRGDLSRGQLECGRGAVQQPAVAVRGHSETQLCATAAVRYCGCTPLRLCATAAVRHCGWTPLQLYATAAARHCCCSPLRLYITMAVCHFSCTILRLHATAAVRCADARRSRPPPPRQDTHPVWTTPRQNGPDHLGLRSNQEISPPVEDGVLARRGVAQDLRSAQPAG